MSLRRVMACLAACAGGLLLAGWLVCGRLPLQAAPQFVQDAPGVTVTGADRILHRGAVAYPAEAREKNIEGTLVLDVLVAPDGTVSDASVITGPAELRSGTLKSVLGWHFRPEAVGRQQVLVEFKAPAPGAPAPKAPAEPSIVTRPAGTVTATPPLPLDRILIRGISKAAEEELRRRLNLPDGQLMDRGAIDRVRRTVRDFDAALTVFELDPERPSPSLGIVIQPTTGATVRPEHAPPPGEARDLSGVPRKLTRIEITGISPEREAELRRLLPVREGDTLDAAARKKLSEAIRVFDPNLAVVGEGAASKRSADRDSLPDVIYSTLRIGPTASREAMEQYSTFRKAPSSVARRLARIDIQGLVPDAAEELRRRLPVKDGQILESEDFRRVEEAAKAFDPHLSSSRISASSHPRLGPDGKPAPPESLAITIHIRPTETALPQASAVLPQAELPPAPPGVQRIRVGGNMQQTKLKHQVRPVYPALAKQERIEGVVKMTALIDIEGNVKSLSAMQGHPVLVEAAMDAVRQWQYQVTLLNGNPVEVVSQVDVNFRLAR